MNILVENEWGERLLVPAGSDPNLILRSKGLQANFKWRLALGGIPTKPQDQGDYLMGKGQERFSEEQKKDGEIVNSAWKATKDTGRSQWP